MYRYFCLVTAALIFSACGPSNTAQNTENQQTADYINKQMATNSAVNGTYAGSYDSVVAGTHRTVNVTLKVIATIVEVPAPSSNQIEKVATILGYLSTPAKKVYDPDATNMNYLVTNKNASSDNWICAPNGQGGEICGVPQDKNFDCSVDAKTKQNLCHHFHQKPAMVIESYAMGIYTPATNTLQFWSTSTLPGQSDNPVIGTPGLSLDLNGNQMSGVYIAPYEVSTKIVLVKQ